MKYIRTKDGIFDVKSTEERLLNEMKDLVEQKIYDFDDDDEDGEEKIEAELKSIKVTSTMETSKIVITCETDVQELYEEYDVVKTSDTIKELLDCFVYIEKGRHKVFYTYQVDPYFDFKYTDSIYGAIWTDKGLIYVAKMNEKGELELL